MFNLLQKSNSVLGMNARNLSYIRSYNLKRAKKIADDKLLCKRVLKKAGLPVPKLIDKIRSKEEFKEFDFGGLPNSFVLKPNFGFGGEGIIVVYGKRKYEDNVWVKADRSTVTEEDLKSQIGNILDGTFSRTGTPDVAFFEERIQLTKEFKPYTYKGIPDIRVIVFNRVPIMAMLRIPTEASRGTSNLHQGGFGVGIDMATGVTTTAVQYDREIEYVPKKRLLLRGIKIPYWKDILEMAVRAQDVSGLGFLGADVAIDRERGPVFMELNARPGLTIQTANQEGMLRRLNRVEGLNIKTVKRGVTLAQNLFGGEIEEEIEEMSGKRVVGTVEKVYLTGKNKKGIEVKAKVDTGADSTSIDVELARELGFGKTIDAFSKVDFSEYHAKESEESKTKEKIMRDHKKEVPDLENVSIVLSSSGASIRPVVKCSYVMDKRKIYSKVNIADRSDLKYPMIIGRADLKKYLVEIK